ncbi:MAG: class I SAM-dependent methyltransferase [Candidatus Omnitrophota bacterium]
MDIEGIKTRQQDDFFRGYINDPQRKDDWKSPRFKKALELINTLGNKNLKIADIGCGLGDFLYVLSQNGYNNIQGFDVSPAALDFARNRGFKVSLTEEYLENIDEKFDLVFCGDILEHIFAPAYFLNRIRGLISPGGKLLVTVPNFGCLYNNCLVCLLPDEIAKAVSFATHSHINHFLPSTLKELLQMEGFQVIKEAGIKLEARLCPGSRRKPIKYITKILFNILLCINNIFIRRNPSIFSPHLVIMVKLMDKPKGYKSAYWRESAYVIE